MGINDLNKRINDIRELIPSFDTDERKEIKKNNKLIEDLLVELKEYKNKIYDSLKEKEILIIPKDNMIEIENNNKINELLSRINYLSDKSFSSKLGFDKNIYNIKYSNNLEEINKNILDIINKFKLVNVNIDVNNFKYSLTLYKYMDVYFKNIDNEDFNKIMKEEFDLLYWECPEIVNHMVICLINLISGYKNDFDSYIKKINGNLNYDMVINEYFELKKDTIDKIYGNEYLSYQDFVTGKININDYLDDSSVKRDTISKFISYDEYCNYSDEEKMYFFNDIRKMYYTICEYISLNNFSYLTDRVKEIYSNKDKSLGSLNSMNKNIKNLDRQRERIAKSLFVLYNRMNDRNRDRLTKKYNSLLNKLNNKINEIINIYIEYDNTIFINDVITKIDDTSTYYDVIKLYDNNYSYLINYMKDSNKDDYNKYKEFLYNPYLVISKNLMFSNNIDIKEKLEDKYNLFEFDFSLDEGNILELRNNLEYLYRLSYFVECNINIDNFKLIIDIDKINNVND